MAGALVLIVAGLVSAHALGLFSIYVLDHDYVKGLVPLFDLGREHNIPSFVSSALFVAGSLGFFTIYRLEKSTEQAHGHWLALAAIFVFLAIDEWFSIHERLVLPVREFWALQASSTMHGSYPMGSPYSSSVDTFGQGSWLSPARSDSCFLDLRVCTSWVQWAWR